MCVDVRKTCECGAAMVQFHLRDNLLQPGVIQRVFCPNCPGDVGFDQRSMLNDNGWVVEYDMLLATMLLTAKLQVEPETVCPEFIFDRGYACWLEMYPGEREEIREEKEKIIALLREDQRHYLQAIQSWNIQRIARLKGAGWRKARQA
ncbi:MAG: hypothetical protein KKE83_10160 [Proteobacteria bacterium]|nr:hypothetical protein [Pseudomonadota bacterium]MBU1547492.1 hypothetical protein [Pseudomonadota bacterium]MBU2620035.1 hypothetical protein [Pseudomonadota bacterium]